MLRLRPFQRASGGGQGACLVRWPRSLCSGRLLDMNLSFGGSPLILAVVNRDDSIIPIIKAVQYKGEHPKCKLPLLGHENS